VTPTFSICPKHSYLAGEHEFCPKCDQEIIQGKKIQENSSADIAAETTTELKKEEIKQ